MTGAALFDASRRYRYRLVRSWADQLGMLDGRPGVACFIGLNPSTADARRDDNTIRRCIAFARREGLGGLVVVNLFAWRATDPAVLQTLADPIGPDNDAHIREAAAGAALIVAAWGAHPIAHGRAAAVRALLAGRELRCLGLTRHGQPRHPLYVAGSHPLLPFPR